jgi:hypothetical protein
MKMAIHPSEILVSALPPGAYFRSSTLILSISRTLLRARWIGATGMVTALSWSHHLSRAGMCSWRVRHRRRG